MALNGRDARMVATAFVAAVVVVWFVAYSVEGYNVSIEKDRTAAYADAMNGYSGGDRVSSVPGLVLDGGGLVDETVAVSGEAGCDIRTDTVVYGREDGSRGYTVRVYRIPEDRPGLAIGLVPGNVD